MLKINLKNNLLNYFSYKIMKTIYFVNDNIGSHVSFAGNITDTLLTGITRGMYSIQFFMGNPKSFTREYICDKDIIKCQKLLGKYPTNIYSHFPYISNLAGKSKKDCLAWSGNSVVDRKLSNVIRNLEYELSVIAQIGKGVVIHPGSFPDRDLGHRTVAKTINKIKFTTGSILLLENCAGEGNKLCRDFTELKFVMDLVTPNNMKHIGICVDTAHIWGQGDYDLRKISEIERMFEEFKSEIGISHFKLLHLNDSKAKLGSKKDRHEHLGEGEIWGKDKSSLIYLLNNCRKYNIPIILETGGPCMYTLSQLN